MMTSAPTDEFWEKCLDDADERFKGKFVRIDKQNFILGCGYGYGVALADFKSLRFKLEEAVATINEMQNQVSPYSFTQGMFGQLCNKVFNIGSAFNSKHPDLFNAYLSKSSEEKK